MKKLIALSTFLIIAIILVFLITKKPAADKPLPSVVKIQQASESPESQNPIGQWGLGEASWSALPAETTKGLKKFTISLWVKTIETTSNDVYWNRPALIGFNTSGCNSGDFGIITNKGFLGMWSGLTNQQECDNHSLTSSKINDNNWHHVVATNNGSTIKLYLDGQDTQTDLPSGLALADYAFYVGANHMYDTSVNYFHQGNLKNVLIYNRALSNAEILDLYSQQY